MRAFLSIDAATTEFVLEVNDKEQRFPGTVQGAVDMHKASGEMHVSMSSDLNHPREFKKFEKHSIDIAAGYLDEAIKAGVISVEKPMKMIKIKRSATAYKGRKAKYNGEIIFPNGRHAVFAVIMTGSKHDSHGGTPIELNLEDVEFLFDEKDRDISDKREVHNV